MNIIKFNKKHNNNQVIEKGYIAKELDLDYLVFNTNIRLYYLPYYTNSPYQYQEFYSEKGYYSLLNNGITLKPVNNNPRINTSKYYNINKPFGEQVSKMIIPKIDKKIINELTVPFSILKIYSYNCKQYYLNNNLYIRRKKNIWDIEYENIIEIEFTCIKVIENDIHHIYEWIPKYENKIEIKGYFEIDGNEFGNNFEIIYKK